MHKQVIGWDIGGAHLKAALLCNGKLKKILQVPCALWKGLAELETAIDQVVDDFKLIDANESLHAITMTGELVDLFDSRLQGVEAISQVIDARLNGKKLYYAANHNFVSIHEVSQRWKSIASTNWHASASYIASELRSLDDFSNVLLIDIGSTTTDFIVIKNGKLHCLGFTDATRLQTEELVYTGVVRTPLMALSQKVMFKTQLTALAAEHFATMADVYRITRNLHESDDMACSADGKQKTLTASARRIARMIGHDASDEDFTAWETLANTFKHIQLTRLVEITQKHLARLGTLENITILGAGAGKFLVKEIANQLGLIYRDSMSLNKTLMFSENVDQQQVEYKTNVCLPAYAVAQLAFNTLESC